MTAAAIRPELFSHLLATRGADREKGDTAATAVSLLLHAAVVFVFVWASASLTTEDPVVTEQPIPVILAGPKDVVTSDAPPRSGAMPGPVRRQPVLVTPDPTVPIPDPGIDKGPWHEPAPVPGPPSGGPPNQGALPGDVMRDGVRISSTIPALLNASDVRRALERTYPAILRDAGIGGQVMVWMLIDENGRVIDTELKEGSGHAALDRAAVDVAGIMRFSPARQDERKVRIWVSIPIRFTTR